MGLFHSTGQLQSTDQPADPQWTAVNAQETQCFGNMAVRKHNEKRGWNLHFQEVYKAWDMTLDKDSGNLYLLHLKALRDNMEEVNYGAIVWVQPDLGKNIVHTWKLLSFKEIAPAGTSHEG